MTIVPYGEHARAEWDALVTASFNGTFLHSRRLLSYHGDRFEDRSLLVRDAEGQLVGLLPAATSAADQAAVVSHPGVTYGGLVHGRHVTGSRMLRALEGIADAYRRQGYAQLVYKPVPRVFQAAPSEDDLYALYRLGARRSQCDLSAAIDLRGRLPVTQRRHRALRKARALGVTVRRDPRCLEPFWAILTHNLDARHGKKPVHSLEEIERLAGWFPDEIVLMAGHIGQELVAGAVLFRTPTVVHTQYLASSPRGMASAALDCVIEHCIGDAAAEQRAHVSFGVSTEREGLVLNDGLHTFKTEFGAGGIVHETYSLAL